MEYLPIDQFEALVRSGGIQLLEEEKLTDDKFSMPFSPEWRRNHKFTGKYNLVVKGLISEKQIGLSENFEKYNSTWELIERQSVNGIPISIFIGWGDKMSSENEIFEGVKFCTETSIVLGLLKAFKTMQPNFFTYEKLNNIVGLEGIPLEKIM